MTEVPDKLAGIYEQGMEGVVPVKLCCRCKQPGEFYPNQHYCKPCQKIIRKEWYNNLPNRLEWRRAQDTVEQRRKWSKARQERYWLLRLEMIEAYGGKCSCCGLTIPQFLTLEHLNGGGNAHRERLHKAACTWAELKKLGWPREGYTLFCWNCQMGKTHFGVCPHQLEAQRGIA